MKEGVKQAINAVRSEAQLLRSRDEDHPLLEGMSHAETLLSQELARLESGKSDTDTTEGSTRPGGRNFENADEIEELKVERLSVGELNIDREGGEKT